MSRTLVYVLMSATLRVCVCVGTVSFQYLLLQIYFCWFQKNKNKGLIASAGQTKKKELALVQFVLWLTNYWLCCDAGAIRLFIRKVLCKIHSSQRLVLKCAVQLFYF